MQIHNQNSLDLSELCEYLNKICKPRQLIRHLDELLYFLVYYHYKEGVECDWFTYSDIHELKQVLEKIDPSTTLRAGN